MSTTPSNEDQNTLHRVDIENSDVDTGEDQKVAEWAKDLGFINVGSQHEKPLYKKDDMYIVDTTQMTFFYKAQQANTSNECTNNVQLNNSPDEGKVADERERLIEIIGSLKVGDIPHEIRNFLGFAATGVIADFIFADRKRLLDKVAKRADGDPCTIRFSDGSVERMRIIPLQALDQIRREEL